MAKDCWAMEYTKYRVLAPTSIPNLYKEVGIYVMETEYNHTKQAVYVERLLVDSGECPPNIKVVCV